MTKTFVGIIALFLGFLGSDWFANRSLEKQRLAYEIKIERYEEDLRAARELKSTIEEGFSQQRLKAQNDKMEAKALSDAGFDALSKSIAGVRYGISGLQTSIAKADRKAVDQFASTTGRLLGTCIQEYVWLGKRANDLRLDLIEHRDSWPRYVQPDEPVQGEK